LISYVVATVSIVGNIVERVIDWNQNAKIKKKNIEKCERRHNEFKI